MGAGAEIHPGSLSQLARPLPHHHRAYREPVSFSLLSYRSSIESGPPRRPSDTGGVGSPCVGSCSNMPEPAEQRNDAKVPSPPTLPEVESPPPEDVIEDAPSTEDILEQAESAEEIVRQQPDVDELLGRHG
jgi:hypothetical protein